MYGYILYIALYCIFVQHAVVASRVICSLSTSLLSYFLTSATVAVPLHRNPTYIRNIIHANAEQAVGHKR